MKIWHSQLFSFLVPILITTLLQGESELEEREEKYSERFFTLYSRVDSNSILKNATRRRKGEKQGKKRLQDHEVN